MWMRLAVWPSRTNLDVHSFTHQSMAALGTGRRLFDRQDGCTTGTEGKTQLLRYRRAEF